MAPGHDGRDPEPYEKYERNRQRRPEADVVDELPPITLCARQWLAVIAASFDIEGHGHNAMQSDRHRPTPSRRDDR
jgi:hypothetical protein